MGVINVTADSFSDGGRYLSRDDAIAHGLSLAEEGADMLDVGGESTRPGARPVPADEERERTESVVAGLVKRCSIPVSIDTSKAGVAAAALDAGAAIVNDVTALGDPEMAGTVARTGAALVLMHMQGEPRTMQKAPLYGDVMREIAAYLRHAMSKAAEAGVDLGRVIIDPGISDALACIFVQVRENVLAQCRDHPTATGAREPRPSHPDRLLAQIPDPARPGPTGRAAPEPDPRPKCLEHRGASVYN